MRQCAECAAVFGGAQLCAAVCGSVQLWLNALEVSCVSYLAMRADSPFIRDEEDHRPIKRHRAIIKELKDGNIKQMSVLCSYVCSDVSSEVAVIYFVIFYRYIRHRQ